MTDTQADAGLVIDGPRLDFGPECERILRALPKWFGIEEAILHYVQAIDELPTFIATMGEGIVGFVSIKRHYERTAEIYVMGVLPHIHRRGVGTALMDAAEQYCSSAGIQYLQVKTLSPQRESTEYEQTRSFYTAMGFTPLEEFPKLWGVESPCLLLVKYLT